jgi:hypothetical protein
MGCLPSQAMMVKSNDDSDESLFNIKFTFIIIILKLDIGVYIRYVPFVFSLWLGFLFVKMVRYPVCGCSKALSRPPLDCVALPAAC